MPFPPSGSNYPNYLFYSQFTSSGYADIDHGREMREQVGKGTPLGLS